MANRVPPRRPPVRPRSALRRPPLRPLVAAAVVAVLAAGWLLVRGSGHPGASAEPGDAASTPSTNVAVSSSVPRVATAALRADLADAGRCVDRAGSVPAVRCAIGGVDADFELVGARVAAAYRQAVGVAPQPQRGTPACAGGRPDERSWARPTAPTRAVGRYACEIAHGHAEMWWSDEHGILAHAVAPDADLAALFTWWRRHPAE